MEGREIKATESLQPASLTTNPFSSRSGKRGLLVVSFQTLLQADTIPSAPDGKPKFGNFKWEGVMDWEEETERGDKRIGGGEG